MLANRTRSSPSICEVIGNAGGGASGGWPFRYSSTNSSIFEARLGGRAWMNSSTGSLPRESRYRPPECVPRSEHASPV